ncbi:amidohydrolase family protein [Neolewinella aurantiaca]|uniref:Amidohydrolase family protein n=1 Tax=Neolewinella aurantiaca TaxID=2602767 RepID=A0A5C7FAR4_9BACT|nr:amidohydrolase family protein [Neolewinella aurantiaca]TXF87907.1 amidohydrolase family protein [Neolewinella aurantiaca]
MTLDSHQHFWKYELPKHDWIDDEMAAIRRNFMPADLQPILAANGVDGCIAVQADQTLAETDFLLDIAAKHDFVKGVVGWIDLRADDLAEQLERYAGQPLLKGFRHVVQGEPDPLFLLQPNFLRGIDLIGQKGYTYDILIFPHQLVSALELVKQFPEYKFVIDHLAKPYAKAGYFTGWAAAMAAIAEFPNVCCKLSGLITEADYHNWTTDELLPYLRHALEVFGPDRCMFGSDWPVCRVAGDYAQVKGLIETLLQDSSPADQKAVFGENCARFYDI